MGEPGVDTIGKLPPHKSDTETSTGGISVASAENPLTLRHEANYIDAGKNNSDHLKFLGKFAAEGFDNFNQFAYESSINKPPHSQVTNCTDAGKSGYSKDSAKLYCEGSSCNESSEDRFLDDDPKAPKDLDFKPSSSFLPKAVVEYPQQNFGEVIDNTCPEDGVRCLGTDYDPLASIENLHEHSKRTMVDYVAEENSCDSGCQMAPSEFSCKVNSSVSTHPSNIEDFGDFVSHSEISVVKASRYIEQDNVAQNVKKMTSVAFQPSVDFVPVFLKSSLSRQFNREQIGTMTENNNFCDFSAFNSVEAKKYVMEPFGKASRTDDFADFSGFQKFCPSPPPNTSATLVKNILFHLRTALDSAFSTDRLAGLEVYLPSMQLSSSVCDAFRAQLAELWEKTSSVSVKNLLTSVCNHPESFASKLVWNSSHTYSMYLATIGVDVRSAQFNRIKLLQPTQVEDHNNNTISPNPATPRSLPTEELVSPVPECCWLINGRTNPLSTENVTQCASEADLEFFKDMPCKSCPKPTDLEAEFLHSAIAPPPKVPLAPNLSTTVFTNTSTLPTPETGISEKISDVLKHLPDFSYLRKSILAFPVSDHQTE